jgi:hypothetical protein
LDGREYRCQSYFVCGSGRGRESEREEKRRRRKKTTLKKVEMKKLDKEMLDQMGAEGEIMCVGV